MGQRNHLREFGLVNGIAPQCLNELLLRATTS
jgi:hypothetical protein